jgi:hypothetical protein
MAESPKVAVGQGVTAIKKLPGASGGALRIGTNGHDPALVAAIGVQSANAFWRRLRDAKGLYLFASVFLDLP